MRPGRPIAPAIGFDRRTDVIDSSKDEMTTTTFPAPPARRTDRTREDQP
jgi:hypothetical protein